MDSDNIEIVDFSGEKFHKFTLSCSLVFIFISILIILIIAFDLLIPGTIVTTLLSLGFIFIFIAYYYYAVTKNPGKLRKFTISNYGIEILLPRQPRFQISWFEIEKIKIQLKKLEVNPYLIYQIHFIQSKSEKNINITLNDFTKEKINEILKSLKSVTRSKKKAFSAVKETNISGIIFVEELKI
ncbi:MAG: hypothetical protein ACFFHD_06800 [Promethearchaeota archaeon]